MSKMLKTGLTEDYVINDLFRFMIKTGASDLHLATGSCPYYRLHGRMIKTELETLSVERIKNLLQQVCNKKQWSRFEMLGDLDFSYDLEGQNRFRCNYLKQSTGYGGVFRIIPTKMPSLEELELPPVLRDIAEYNQGLVIITGATGSGKSTTLASMINYINQRKDVKIITIEDPVEFVHSSSKSLIVHREIGKDAKSFAIALRAAIREDPDIILIGEMRDLETMALAVTAADMGRLVFATLHTNSAAKSIDRIIDVFPPEQQGQIRSMISVSLKAVIAQILLETADGKGRCAAVEILINTPAMGNLIREGKTAQLSSVIVSGKSMGMQSMDSALKELVDKGKITMETAQKRATIPLSFTA